MHITLPHTIENGQGEKIIFKEIIKEPDGDKLIIEGFCKPNCGPPMHVHFKQDESLSVRKGRMGYQVFGEEKQFASEGETVFFKRGVAHKFWNAGDDELQMDNWAKPANSLVFFLSSLYQSQLNSGKAQPDRFDGAYLMTRYRREYDMLEIPSFVKKTIIPFTYQLGKLLGKYQKFKDAPTPL